jgi:cell division protein FtsB
MKEFQHGNESERKGYSKWVLLVLFVLIVLVGRGLLSISAKQMSSSEEMDLVEAKRAELQERYNNLSGRVGELNTNEGMEREIRSKFDVAKPGETVIMVVDKEIPAPIQKETSIIKKLWNDVVGVFKKKS